MPALTDVFRGFRSMKEAGSSIRGHGAALLWMSASMLAFVAVLFSDLAYWWFAHEFWARLSFILVAAGVAAALAAWLVRNGSEGSVDTKIRILAPPPRRSLETRVIMMAIAVLAVANLALRTVDPIAAILPWGLALTAVTALVIVASPWREGPVTKSPKFESHEPRRGSRPLADSAGILPFTPVNRRLRRREKSKRW